MVTFNLSSQDRIDTIWFSSVWPTINPSETPEINSRDTDKPKDPSSFVRIFA